jgi:IS4 transposase
VDKTTGVQSDQTIMLTTHYPAQNYPEPLRRIRFYDPQRQKRLVFLTNNFELPAETIAQLYKARWHIELFFKWIKQHLRIKSFFGISENAVKVQIWTAISAYLLVAIMKKELRLEQSLYTILQVLSLSLFEKMPILQAFSQKCAPISVQQNYKQLSLFD